MARGCNGGFAGALLVGHGALVPLASPAKEKRFWYDFRNCGVGVLGEGTTWVSRFDPFAADQTQIDVAWTGDVSFRCGH
jgi:hypothetical protein